MRWRTRTDFYARLARKASNQLLAFVKRVPTPARSGFEAEAKNVLLARGNTERTAKLRTFRRSVGIASGAHLAGAAGFAYFAKEAGNAFLANPGPIAGLATAFDAGTSATLTAIAAGQLIVLRRLTKNVQRRR